MPDCPGKEERKEGLSITWAGGWTQTGLKLETQGKMSCPGSDAWAVLWSLNKERKRTGNNVTLNKNNRIATKVNGHSGRFQCAVKNRNDPMNIEYISLRTKQRQQSLESKVQGAAVG